MKGYDMQKYEFKELFRVVALLTNFLLWKRNDFSETIEREPNNYEAPWAGE